MSNAPIATSRRNFLQFATIGAATIAAAPSASSAREKPMGPPDVGRKFAANGRVLPFSGNTIVCHLDQQGDLSKPFEVLLDFYRDAPTRNYMSSIAVLPPSSYHMTILGTATDTSRQPDKWPSGIPRDASIADCSRIIGERIQRASIEKLSSIRMRVDDSASGYDGNTLRMPLVPVDKQEARKIQLFREQLSNVAGLPSVARTDYQFHVTLAYVVKPFGSSELAQSRTDLEALKARLAKSCPEITLGTPEYCTFDDMFAFHRQFYV